MTPALLRVLSSLSLLLVAGCSYTDRAIPLEAPSQPIEEALSRSTTNSIDLDENIPYDWWKIFQDEQLNTFVSEGLLHNPTFQQTRAKILYAASVAARARSSLYPNLIYGADVARQKFSETGIIPFNTANKSGLPNGAGIPGVATGGFMGIPVYFTQFETELSLTYDFDFWGKNCNTLKAAIGEMNAAIADEIFARLQFSVAIVQTYFRLQIDYQRQILITQLVKDREAYLDLMRQRVQGNLTDALTLRAVETNVSETIQKLLEVKLEVSLRENQLRAYLAQDFNEDIDPYKILPKQLPKVPIPQNLPVHLLARRPDITSQLWLIESAGRQIQVAKAGFYPDFNISALFGFQTISFPKLFNWPSTFFNVDPAVSLPIFDGGRLQAEFFRSEINYDLAILKYNELVLNAVREVLDGLASLQNSEKQVEVFGKIANDQRELLRLTTLRVENNISSNLDKLLREEALLEAEDNEIAALGNKIDAILNLIKAIGGGYECCESEG